MAAEAPQSRTLFEKIWSRHRVKEREDDQTLLYVDLPAQTVTFPDGAIHGFDVDPFDKHCSLEGLDELA